MGKEKTFYSSGNLDSSVLTSIFEVPALAWSQERDDGRMNLPQNSHLRRSSLLRMFKILEWQSQDTDREGQHQLPTMARVQLKTLLLDLRLNITTVGAMFAVHGRLDNPARWLRVGYLRALMVNCSGPQIRAGLCAVCAA